MKNKAQNTLLSVPLGELFIPAFNTAQETPIYFSLIIPTYNEGQNIDKIIHVLSEILDDFIPNNYELIVVDDNSPDQTWKIALDLTSIYPQLKVMRRQQERGLSTAVVRGWQAAQGQILGVIDGDLQHPPEVLTKLLTSIAAGADLAVASRHIEDGGVSDWGLVRRILSRGAQLLGLIILPGVLGRVSDPMSGYFIVRRSAIFDCLLVPKGYKILLEVLGRGNISTIAEVGYVFQERLQGSSKVTWKQYVEYLQHLLSLRFSTGRIGLARRRFSLPLRRFIQYGLVGFSGVFVDMALLYILHDTSRLGLGLTTSKVIAAQAAIINNFIWNDFWTFRDLAKSQPGWKKRAKRLLKFNLICLVGLFLNVIFLNFFFNILHINYLFANLLAIVVVTLFNFWLNLKLSWRVTEIK